VRLGLVLHHLRERGSTSIGRHRKFSFDIHLVSREDPSFLAPRRDGAVPDCGAPLLAADASFPHSNCNSPIKNSPPDALQKFVHHFHAPVTSGRGRGLEFFPACQLLFNKLQDVKALVSIHVLITIATFQAVQGASEGMEV